VWFCKDILLLEKLGVKGSRVLTSHNKNCRIWAAGPSITTKIMGDILAFGTQTDTFRIHGVLALSPAWVYETGFLGILLSCSFHYATLNCPGS